MMVTFLPPFSNMHPFILNFYFYQVSRLQADAEVLKGAAEEQVAAWGSTNASIRNEVAAAREASEATVAEAAKAGRDHEGAVGALAAAAEAWGASNRSVAAVSVIFDMVWSEYSSSESSSYRNSFSQYLPICPSAHSSTHYDSDSIIFYFLGGARPRGERDVH